MKKRILIIEDEQTLIQALVNVFSDENYKIETAIDGEIGWEKVNSFKPDLILLDLVLSKIDGFSLLSKIKATDTIKDIPVIILTNLSDAIDKCMEVGAKACLIKSNETIEDIKKEVRKVLK